MNDRASNLPDASPIPRMSPDPTVVSIVGHLLTLLSVELRKNYSAPDNHHAKVLTMIIMETYDPFDVESASAIINLGIVLELWDRGELVGGHDPEFLRELSRYPLRELPLFWQSRAQLSMNTCPDHRARAAIGGSPEKVAKCLDAMFHVARRLKDNVSPDSPNPTPHDVIRHIMTLVLRRFGASGSEPEMVDEIMGEVRDD